jgi:hypothetical protein
MLRPTRPAAMDNTLTLADELRGPDLAAPFGLEVKTASSDPVTQLVAVSGRTP